MHKIFLPLLLTLAANAEPQIDATVYPGPNNQGLIFVVQGNDEVKDIKLLTPIDPRYYLVKGKNTILFFVPPTLPVYPSLLFQVNGTEIHYTSELKASDFLPNKGQV